MTRPRCALWVVCIASGLLSGCAGIDAWLTEAIPTTPSVITHELRQGFESRAWRFGPDWTPLVECQPYPRKAAEAATRWSHPRGGAIPSQFIDLVTTHSEPNTRRLSPEEWDWEERLQSHLSDDFLGWNAAIVLAQRGWLKPRHEWLLERLVSRDRTWRPTESEKDQPVPKSLRAAAAEAWCLALATHEGDPETTFAPVGRLLTRDLPEEIRAELLRGTARSVMPRRIPALVGILQSPSAGTGPSLQRRAAIDGCVLHAIHHPTQIATDDVQRWASETGGDTSPSPDVPRCVPEDSPFPAEVWDLQHDGDVYVRVRYGTLLVLVNHPQAMTVLKGQLDDGDPNVVRGALVNLGLLGTAEARELLDERAREPGQHAAALAAGLAFFGPEALRALSRHASGAVRREVAQRLSGLPGEASLPVLQPLFSDAQIQVQDAAIESAAAWPDPLGSQAVLAALVESPTLRTRRAALRELEKRHGVQTFPLEGDPSARALAAARLAAEWGLPDGATDPRATQDEAQDRLSGMRSAEVSERLRGWAEARGTPDEVRESLWFDTLTPRDVPVIEELLDRVEQSRGEFLRTKVLPRLNPAYEALARLEPDQPLAARQRGAGDLHRLGATRPWPRPVLQRLKSLLPREPDPDVWRSVMNGLVRDQRREAAEIALLALHGQWPDVRALGCQYVAHHGQPDQATWIMPLFTESNPVVQRAAILAAGQCRNPLVLEPWTAPGGGPPTPGLRALWPEARGDFRIVLAGVMSRLGDRDAERELVRVLHDDSPSLRISAATAMGDSGQAAFVDALIKAVWTETHPQVRQAGLTSLKRLVPVDQHPAGLDQAGSAQAAAELWSTWR